MASKLTARKVETAKPGSCEVRADRDDRYILSGFDKGFSKKRFEIVSQPTIGFSGRGAAARH